MTTRIGEMRDLIDCLSVYHGADLRQAPKTGFLQQFEIE